MALVMFHAFGNGRTDAQAFAAAQQCEHLAGRTIYELIDPTTLYPSDQHAFTRAEYLFGVVPQADKVCIAGENTNTVWAIRVHIPQPGMKRMLFCGLRRV